MNNEDSNIPKFFIGIILIALSVLGTATIMHLHQFSKQDNSTIEQKVRIVS
ncbi:MAG: hypothetical protein ACFBSE_13525 [Prochloraceae cyanobacterium]